MCGEKEFKTLLKSRENVIKYIKVKSELHEATPFSSSFGYATVSDAIYIKITRRRSHIGSGNSSSSSQTAIIIIVPESTSTHAQAKDFISRTYAFTFVGSWVDSDELSILT